MGLNPGQERAVREREKHLLVAAGAGTGKTHTVVHRLLHELGVDVLPAPAGTPVADARPTTPLHALAAITFTNAAAAELKAKLRAALLEHGAYALATEVDVASVGTIHAFCGDLLRQHGLRAGRSPELAVLDEGQAAALAAEVARDTVVEILAGDGTDVALGALLESHGLGDVTGWVQTLMRDADRLARLDGGDAAGEALLALAHEARRRLVARLEAERAADFDRLIVATRDLLRDEPAVRRAVQRTLRLLVIDEFQDVDPAMHEIAWLIAEPGSGRADTPRLLLVGDPKQSIYRFRRADVTLWRKAEREFERLPDADIVRLDESRRSIPAILAFVDAAVGPVLDAPIEAARRDYEVDYAPIRATQADLPGPGVELFAVDGGGGKVHVTPQREAEAAWVARRFRALHQERGIPWGEMALLLPTWTVLDTYMPALEAAGIPAYANRSGKFWSCREVQDVVLALRAVRDHADEVAVTGFLRGPMVGVRDETLVGRVVGRAPGAAGEEERLQAGLGLLGELRELRDRVPVHRLVERLLERTGYLAHLLAQEDRQQAIANVMLLLERLQQWSSEGVGEVLRLVREQVELGDEAPQARLYDRGEDVVTVSSIHSAKGLEWTVVAWADLSRQPKEKDDAMLVGRDRLALKGDDEKAAPGPWTDLRDEEAREEEAERRRLWYVATTRAKRHLLLAGFRVGTQEKSSPAAALHAALGKPVLADGGEVAYTGADGTPRAARVHVQRVGDGMAGAPAPAPVPSLEALAARVPAAPAPIVAPLGRRRHSATELMQHAACPTRHWYRYVMRVPEPPPEDAARGAAGPRPARPDARAVGTAVHDVLERIRHEEELDDLLEAAIVQRDLEVAAPDSAAGTAFRDEVRRQVREALASPEFAATGGRRELRFTWLRDDGRILEGAADLVTPADGGLAVTDVKTAAANPGDEPQVAAKYALQRDAYVAALGAIEAPVQSFTFYFPATDARVTEAFDEPARAAAAARLDAALDCLAAPLTAPDARRTTLDDHARRPTLPLATDPNLCTRCGYRRPGWCPGATPETA